MTWVVGASTLFGYGAVISDIQVTCQASGRRMDVLQKAYPVGKFVVAGFAGDVRTGLTLIENLRGYLNSVDAAEDECWDPEWIADNWPAEARKTYHELGEAAEAHVLMLGLKAAGTQEKRVMGGAIGHLSIFRSPNFEPCTEMGGRKAMSIGCGAGVEKYTSMLEHVMRDDDLNYMKSEIYNIGGYGRRIAETLSWMVKQNPQDGISEYFQLFIVRMGRIEQWNPRNMPRLAYTWDELLKMLDKDMDSHALTATALSEFIR